LQHVQRNSNFPWNYTSIFLDIPDELIRSRLRQRGRTSEENIAKRIIMASDQRALARDICSYYLDASGTLAECVREVNDIIKKDCC
jgi:ribose 1,5-bisphosphokinase PhnN